MVPVNGSSAFGFSKRRGRRRRDCAGLTDLVLVGQVETRRYLMLDRPRVEAGAQIRLVIPNVVLGQPVRTVAIDHRVVVAGKSRRGGDRIARRVTVAKLRAESQPVAEIVLEFHRAQVRADILFVARAEAVEGVARHRRRLVAKRGERVVRRRHPGNAVVGKVVLPHAEVARRSSRVGRAHAKRNRRRDSPRAGSRQRRAPEHRRRDTGSSGGTRFVHRGRSCPADVYVRRAALHARRTEAQRSAQIPAQVRRLTHKVDRAACRSAAGVSRLRSLDHFHLLEVERIARLRTEVAHAVDKHVVACAEPAHASGCRPPARRPLPPPLSGRAHFAALRSVTLRPAAQ